MALLSIFALAAGPTVSRLLLPARGAFISAAASHPLAEPAMSEATVPLHGMGSAHHHHHDMAMASVPAPSHAPSHDHALEHCGQCLLAAHAFTFVQERPALTAFVASTRPALDRIASTVPRLRCDWSPASSRGPPLQA